MARRRQCSGQRCCDLRNRFGEDGGGGLDRAPAQAAAQSLYDSPKTTLRGEAGSIVAMKEDLKSVKSDLVRTVSRRRLKEKQLLNLLTPGAVQSFQAIQSKTFYPKGSTLFAEGEPPAGIFILWKGKANLSVRDHKGKRLLLRTTGAGEMLGLSATVSGEPYEMTAQALTPSQAGFIARDDFLDFLRNHVEAAFRVVKLLSDNVTAASEQIRRLGSPGTRRRKAQPGGCV